MVLNIHWFQQIKKKKTQMQKKRWRKLGFMRRVLTCAIVLISLVALFSAHLHLFFPPSQVSMLPDPYKVCLFKDTFAKRLWFFWVIFDCVFSFLNQDWRVLVNLFLFFLFFLLKFNLEKVSSMGKIIANYKKRFMGYE